MNVQKWFYSIESNCVLSMKASYMNFDNMNFTFQLHYLIELINSRPSAKIGFEKFTSKF